jgi:hypothetical protein
MTHKEREAYVRKLMSVLEGGGPEIVVTESGELETLRGAMVTLPLDFLPWGTLTSADRRDRAALRALRAEVLREWPFPRTFGRGVTVDPLAPISVLSRPVEGIPDEYLGRVVPEQVWSWVSRFLQIEQRATYRWRNRGYGLPDGLIIRGCELWVRSILLGHEHLLAGQS